MYQSFELFRKSALQQIRALLAAGCKPLCAATSLSFDETPTVLRPSSNKNRPPPVAAQPGPHNKTRDAFKETLRVVQLSGTCGCVFSQGEQVVHVELPMPPVLRIVDHCTGETIQALLKQTYDWSGFGVFGFLRHKL